MNKNLALLFLALAVVGLIAFAFTGSTYYLAVAGINLCVALAGFFNNRISLIFLLLGGGGMIYILLSIIRALLA